ncbi:MULTISPECIES: T9SS-dependent M36 family metallopeptidase [Chryseobacterium]|uniref:T9SS-dependent M36 family metallopeptidase n=1 Tax=Chryseobacterium TaxID=59732 RepID=UPI000C9E57E1|nr:MULTISPECIES: T9SS-dependent M36 family metallopeptidase [Chryseobacterium]VXB88718.1 Por secretion system C-terminal sorting domain-containing protein [Chryseobacterium sp. 8AT]
MRKIIISIMLAGFTMPTAAQDNVRLIKDYLYKNNTKEFKKRDLTDFRINMVDESKSLKGTVVKFQQTYKGIPIYASSGSVLVKNEKIVYLTENFVKNYNYASKSTPSITAESALGKIADELKNPEINKRKIVDRSSISSHKADIDNNATYQLCYVNDDGNLKLAYNFLVPEIKKSNSWVALVNADTGEIINIRNSALSCSFDTDINTHDESMHYEKNSVVTEVTAPNALIHNNQKSKQTAPLLAPDNASYKVFALPLEAPSFGQRTVKTNPWILSVSPEGWHYDGVDHHTVTKGNNADVVYPFFFNSDGVDVYADGGASRNFDFPFDPALLPKQNVLPALTNVFYLANKLHDTFYLFGFTETAKNFQQAHFITGAPDGIDDAIRIYIQSDTGINNATYMPFYDGFSPVITTHLWQNNKMVKYNSPIHAVNRKPSAGRTAGFGKSLTDIGVTGDIMLSPILNGCTPMPAGSLNGKIALIERSYCQYATPVRNAKDAGAIAVVIYNDPANGDNLELMKEYATQIDIPAILITNIEGEFIKSQLATNANVNITMKRGDITLDSTLDNGVITHEFGHGVSTRLTGTDGSDDCLVTSVSKEQMGEGWSDFFALMLTNQPGNNASVPRGMGSYVLDESTTGKGIRLVKYSPDFAINDYTYGDTNGMERDGLFGKVTLVHDIGFVWGTMLWDLNWEYVAKYGYASDVTTNPNSGSAKVLHIVMDGLKLQQCNPSFVDARNAILAADMATTGGADKCMIWKTFAKRGLGINATSGLYNNINDQTENFEIPAECNSLATNEVSAKEKLAIFPNPAGNEFFIRFPKQTTEKVNIEIYDITGRLVYNESGVNTNSTKSVSTKSISNGVYIVKVNGIEYNESLKLIIKK